MELEARFMTGCSNSQEELVVLIGYETAVGSKTGLNVMVGIKSQLGHHPCVA
jgi:hypothetical protein